MLYLVLGMHKSGTTLVSQILHHSGIPMDDEIDAAVSYDKGNKYERQSVFELNLEFLEDTWFEQFYLGGEEAFPEADRYRERIARIVERGEATGRDWGFKDPRLALTYPLWRPLLPEHRIIMIFRDPAEVWPRYRYKRWYNYPRNFGRARDHALRWFVHNRNLLELLRHTEMDHVVLEYSHLMTEQEEFARLERFVERPLDDRRRPDLYRNRRQSYHQLQLADRHLQKRYGSTLDDLMGELQELRRQNIARSG